MSRRAAVGVVEFLEIVTFGTFPLQDLDLFLLGQTGNLSHALVPVEAHGFPAERAFMLQVCSLVHDAYCRTDAAP
jgi:hypothetical protein